MEPQVPGAPEQPRALLVGVPYALKAADADTLGGLPASAFLMAPGVAQPVGDPAPRADRAAAVLPNTSCSVTSDGTAMANEIAFFTTACNVEGSSTIVESSGRVGIGTASSPATLAVIGATKLEGATTLGGAVTLPATGTATGGTTGTDYGSQPLNLVASAYNTAAGAAAAQTFQLQAGPVGNNSGATSGTLNLLYGAGANPLTNVLQIASNGQITFAAGQTFPGTTPAGVVGVNPLQVALLKWFPAYQSAAFPVGSNPAAVAFDGANIWVTNLGSNTVTKLLAATGAVSGTFTVGSFPIGVAFDGANIWVTNYGTNTVSKL